MSALIPHRQYLHANPLDAKTPTQEWSLIRFSLPQRTFPRPRASLQSCAAHILLKKCSLRLLCDPTRSIEWTQHLFSQTTSSAWYFTYIGDHSAHEPSFAIVSKPISDFLTHKGSYINSSRYDPWNKNHMWQPLPRDNVFILRNRGTGELLCHEASDEVDVDHNCQLDCCSRPSLSLAD